MIYTAFPNTFRRDILAGKRLIGCWSSLANPITTEILGLAGFDWLLLDAEHAPNDVLTLIPQLMALKDSPSAPVVRPPVNDAVIIKRLLDAGFYNFLIPFVESAEQARRAVAATRYPPAGIRGVSVAQRSNRYGTVSDYFATVNDQICVLVQIESRAGMENLDGICAVEGVDGIFIGPSDLAAALGISETPATPRCRQQCGISSPALGAMGARWASLPPWKRTLAATLNKESNSWRSAPTRVSFGQPHRRCGTGFGSRPHRVTLDYLASGFSFP
jgi:2-dehydro-3-deoxyglucarate aldolase